MDLEGGGESTTAVTRPSSAAKRAKQTGTNQRQRVAVANESAAIVAPHKVITRQHWLEAVAKHPIMPRDAALSNGQQLVAALDPRLYLDPDLSCVALGLEVCVPLWLIQLLLSEGGDDVASLGIATRRATVCVLTYIYLALKHPHVAPFYSWSAPSPIALGTVPATNHNLASRFASMLEKVKPAEFTPEALLRDEIITDDRRWRASVVVKRRPLPGTDWGVVVLGYLMPADEMVEPSTPFERDYFAIVGVPLPMRAISIDDVVHSVRTLAPASAYAQLRMCLEGGSSDVAQRDRLRPTYACSVISPPRIALIFGGGTSAINMVVEYVAWRRNEDLRRILVVTHRESVWRMALASVVTNGTKEGDPGHLSLVCVSPLMHERDAQASTALLVYDADVDMASQRWPRGARSNRYLATIQLIGMLGVRPFDDLTARLARNGPLHRFMFHEASSNVMFHYLASLCVPDTSTATCDPVMLRTRHALRVCAGVEPMSFAARVSMLHNFGTVPVDHAEGNWLLTIFSMEGGEAVPDACPVCLEELEPLLAVWRPCCHATCVQCHDDDAPCPLCRAHERPLLVLTECATTPFQPTAKLVAAFNALRKGDSTTALSGLLVLPEFAQRARSAVAHALVRWARSHGWLHPTTVQEALQTVVLPSHVVAMTFDGSVPHAGHDVVLFQPCAQVLKDLQAIRLFGRVRVRVALLDIEREAMALYGLPPLGYYTVRTPDSVYVRQQRVALLNTLQPVGAAITCALQSAKSLLCGSLTLSAATTNPVDMGVDAAWSDSASSSSGNSESDSDTESDNSQGGEPALLHHTPPHGMSAVVHAPPSTPPRRRNGPIIARRHQSAAA
jgi:hypothetical protein